jgi:hypothetical protein
MTSIFRNQRRVFALVLLGGGTVVGGAAADRTAEASRYPYDPVCSWGRLADGRGMLVRCLSEHEMRSLGSAAVPAASSRPEPVGSAASEPAAAAGNRLPVEVDIGPVSVESGKLPEALKKLRAAKDRFKSCVNYPGALTQPNAEVRIRFLVRERGRAEGVTVVSRQGVSTKAAKCLADVVDRRNVGIPDAPMVGATAVLRFTRPGE